ncbi:MAG: hypothetical protein ABI251_04705, partial [Mycobacteriaceae bacterium]
TQGPTAVQQVTPQLTQQLFAAGVPAPAQATLLQNFRRCSEQRLASADPSAAPPGCTPGTAAPGSPEAKVGQVLESAGMQAGGQSFLQAQRRILWLFAGVLVAVMGLALALPRRTAGHGG